MLLLGAPCRLYDNSITQPLCSTRNGKFKFYPEDGGKSSDCEWMWRKSHKSQQIFVTTSSGIQRVETVAREKGSATMSRCKYTLRCLHWCYRSQMDVLIAQLFISRSDLRLVPFGWSPFHRFNTHVRSSNLPLNFHACQDLLALRWRNLLSRLLSFATLIKKLHTHCKGLCFKSLLIS